MPQKYLLLSHAFQGILLAILVLLFVKPSFAQYDTQSKPKPDPCIRYDVDPNWPEKTAEIPWDTMSSVVLDGQQNVWIVTRSEIPVQCYSPEGKLIRSWGKGMFHTPHFMKFDPQGNIWIVDTMRHVVQKFTVEGKLLMTLGTADQSGCDASHFLKPADVLVTGAGDIFIADGYGNSRVVHYDSNGVFVKEWGTPGTQPGQFDIVHAIAMDSQGRLYIADRNNARIQIFDQEGKFLDQWADILVPWCLFINARDEIWVAGSSPMPMQNEGKFAGYRGVPPKDQIFAKFNPAGRLLQLWTVPVCPDDKPKPGQCAWIHCIAEDARGNFFVGDVKGKRIQKFVRKTDGF